MTQHEIVESALGSRSPVFRLFTLCTTSLNPSPRSKKTNWNNSSLGWPTQTDHRTLEIVVGVSMWSLSDGHCLGPSHFIQVLCQTFRKDLQPRKWTHMCTSTSCGTRLLRIGHGDVELRELSIKMGKFCCEWCFSLNSCTGDKTWVDVKTPVI